MPPGMSTRHSVIRSTNSGAVLAKANARGAVVVTRRPFIEVRAQQGVWCLCHAVHARRLAGPGQSGVSLSYEESPVSVAWSISVLFEAGLASRCVLAM